MYSSNSPQRPADWQRGRAKTRWSRQMTSRRCARLPAYRLRPRTFLRSLRFCRSSQLTCSRSRRKGTRSLPCRSLLAACSPPTTLCSVLTAYYLLLTAHYSLLTTPCLLLTTHCLPLTAHGSLPTAYSSLLTPHSPLLTPHYSLLTTHYSLLPTYCLLLATFYMLLLVYCSQRATSNHPSIHPSMHPSMHACIHPSIHPSIHASIQVAVQIAMEQFPKGQELEPIIEPDETRGGGGDEEDSGPTALVSRTLGVLEVGDCPYGVGSVVRDSNGKLLRRGDHICRQGGW